MLFCFAVIGLLLNPAARYIRWLLAAEDSQGERVRNTNGRIIAFGTTAATRGNEMLILSGTPPLCFSNSITLRFYKECASMRG